MKLVDIARQVEEKYIEVELSAGKFKIYAVPEPIVWMIKPDWEPEPEPELPIVEMKVSGGATQRRPLKSTDKGHADYQAQLSDSRKQQRRHATETNELQQAARYVYAFRDQLEYPDDLSAPPPGLGFINGTYPPESPDDLLRKHFWLKAILLSGGPDYSKVNNAISEHITGVKAEAVDEVKKNSESGTKDDESA